MHANLDGIPYPDDPQKIRTRWVENLENCVDFVAQVEQMYAAGVRTFVEIGPGRVSSGLVRRILQERPHRGLAVDGAGRSEQGGLAGWLAVMAELFAAGLPLRVEMLFRGRAVRWIDLDLLPENAASAPRWLIDGGRIWVAGAERHDLGELPLLTLETSQAANSHAVSSQAVSSQLPSTPDGIGPVLGQEDALSAVYREYQQTMRQFLEQQERLMGQILARDTQTSDNGQD